VEQGEAALKFGRWETVLDEKPQGDGETRQIKWHLFSHLLLPRHFFSIDTPPDPQQPLRENFRASTLDRQ